MVGKKKVIRIVGTRVEGNRTAGQVPTLNREPERRQRRP